MQSWRIGLSSCRQPPIVARPRGGGSDDETAQRRSDRAEVHGARALERPGSQVGQFFDLPSRARAPHRCGPQRRRSSRTSHSELGLAKQTTTRWKRSSRRTIERSSIDRHRARPTTCTPSSRSRCSRLESTSPARSRSPELSRTLAPCATPRSKAKGKTFVWFNYRRCPAIAFAWKLIREKRIGRSITCARTTCRAGAARTRRSCGASRRARRAPVRARRPQRAHHRPGALSDRGTRSRDPRRGHRRRSSRSASSRERRRRARARGRLRSCSSPRSRAALWPASRRRAWRRRTRTRTRSRSTARRARCKLGPREPQRAVVLRRHGRFRRRAGRTAGVASSCTSAAGIAPLRGRLGGRTGTFMGYEHTASRTMLADIMRVLGRRGARGSVAGLRGRLRDAAGAGGGPDLSQGALRRAAVGGQVELSAGRARLRSPRRRERAGSRGRGSCVPASGRSCGGSIRARDPRGSWLECGLEGGWIQGGNSAPNGRQDAHPTSNTAPVPSLSKASRTFCSTRDFAL